MAKLVFAAVAIASLASCAAKSAEQKLCETGSRQALANPDTATFDDFRPIEQSELFAYFAAAAEQKHGFTWDKDHLKSSFETFDRSIGENTNMAFFAAKVTSENKQGERATRPMVCLLTKNNGACSCHNPLDPTNG